MYFNCIEDVKRDLECEILLLRKFKKRMSYLKRHEGLYLKINDRKDPPQYYIVKRQDGREVAKYARKEEAGIVDEIQEYRYMKFAIKACEQNIKHLQALVNNYRSLAPPDVVRNFGRSCQQQHNATKLIFNYRDAASWIAAKELRKAEFNVYKPEGLIHIAGDGTRKRSKSEVLISDCLDSLGIPHVYEYPIWIDGEKLLPDFLCLDAATGQEVVIEHFGLMVKDSYREGTYSKLEKYIKAGYLINVDLIIIFEDINGNINAESIKNILKARFRL